MADKVLADIWSSAVILFWLNVAAAIGQNWWNVVGRKMSLAASLGEYRFVQVVFLVLDAVTLAIAGVISYLRHSVFS